MMPPNLNLATNPRSGDSNLQALSLAMAGVDGDGDDDDFQNPSQSVLSQSLMLSSLKSRLSQPLKPSNGYRARKRRRPSAAYGKENDSMLKNRTSDSRVSKDGKEKNLGSTRKAELYHKIVPAGLGNIDIAGGCVEEDGIEDLKSNLTASDVPRFVDGWPCEEGQFGRGSLCLVSVESTLSKSAVSASSNSDLDCSNVCTSFDELGPNLRSYCDGEKPVAVWETESAHECRVCNEAEEGVACLASTELGTAEDWPRREMEILISNHTEGRRKISSEARLLESKEKSVLSGCRDDSSGRHGSEELKSNRKFLDPKVHERGPIGAGIVLSDKKNRNHHAMSVEAKLLGSSRKLVPPTVTRSSEEVHVSDEFEPGTQLNMLMDLCCQMGEQGGSVSRMSTVEEFNLDTEPVPIERNLLLQCPLCQTDITKLSEEMRQIHTNDCLDKDDMSEVSIPIGQSKPNACNQVVDTNPVLEWLRALDLCRYEEAFIREEIDWDTLQWLTEEATLPRLKSMTWSVELRNSIPGNRYSIITLKLQDGTKSHLDEVEVKFQLSRDTLEAMLRSMTCINDQLSDSGRLQPEPTTKGQGNS